MRLVLATAKDVMVIVRWDDGSLGLTGWGSFWLLLFLFSVGR